MRTAISLLAVAVLTTAGVSPAGELRSPALSFTLMDGSFITGGIDADSLSVKTRYGSLQIPVGELICFTPGLDSHPDLADRIGVLVAALGSPEKAKRDQARKELIEMGPWMETIISGYAADQPPEGNTEMAAILEAYKKARGGAAAGKSLAWKDKLETEQFTAVGQISPRWLEVASRYGKLDVKLDQIRQARIIKDGDLGELRETCDHVAVELRDGTHAKGTVDLAAVAVATPYGKLDVPLGHVSTITFSERGKAAQVQLGSGEQLHGKVRLKTIELTTSYGTLAIPISEVVRIEVHAGRIEDGLAYYWSFDNADAVDSLRGVKGQIVGDVVFADGVFGKAPVFKNHSTKIVIQSPEFNVNGWKQATLSMWGKMNSYSTYGNAITRAEGNQGCGLSLSVGGNYGYWVGGSFGVRLGKDSVLSVQPRSFRSKVKPYPKTGVWYHLVGTYDGRRVRVYVNGKLEGEKAAETPGLPLWDLPGAKMVIGRSAAANHKHWRDTYFPGPIDEVKIWRRALTGPELGQLYEQGLPPGKTARR